MLSNFRLPWCNEQQMLPKMSQDALSYSAAVDMPMFGKFKRQLPETDVPHSSQQSKKPRLEVETARMCVRPPMKSEASPAVSRAVQLPTPVTPNVSRPVALAPPTPTSEQVKVVAPAVQTVTTAAPSAPLPAGPKEPPRTEVTTAPPALDCIADMTPLQQVIDNEFNMAMLMKHNELRLIEQELAKCQVALEQLRRCELRPYPGYDCPSSDVTAGTGPAIAPGPGMSRPAYPPPHGVTDGPYSRHYRQWLLRDPEFDSAPMHMYSSMDTPTSAGGRSTRNLGSARKSVSSRTHAVTNRIDSLPSIPNYPAPAPKDKSAPLVLRRSTDNQLVKLICNNCLRGNFSSIQGFLNHCRIAHKVDYKSHDLAAIDCGRLLDEADLAKLPAETHSLPVAGTPTPKAHGSRAASNASSKLAASTPVAAASKSLPALVVPTPTQPQHREMAKGFVHALNSPSATLPTPPSSVARRRAPVKSKSTFQARATSSLPPPALSITTSTNDKSSTTAPRLSAHFAKQGFRPEMFAQAFANAKQSMDETFSQFDSCGGDSAMMTPVGTPSDEDVDSPLMFQRQPQNSTRPARPSLLIAPTTTASTTSKSTESSTLGLAANAPSPSTTSSTSSLSHANSPHLLPGLVSDHEDDDDHSHVDDHDDDVVMVDSVVDLDSHFADAVQDDHHHHHHHHENNDEDEDDDVVVVACKANGKN